MKSRLDTLKAVLIVAVIMVICLIIISNINKSLKSKIDEYASQLKASVSQKAIDELEDEVLGLQGRLAGLSEVFDIVLVQEEPILDESIVFAQKLDVIRKQLLIKAELRGGPAPMIEVPQKLPSKEKASFFIRHIEELERVVDLGIKAGLDFTLVKIPGSVTEGEADKLQVELRFVGQGPAVSQYLLLLTEFIPLLSIEEFSSGEDGPLSYRMKIVKKVLGERSLDLKNPLAQAHDYSPELSLSMGAKEMFLNSDIFKVIERTTVAAKPAKVTAKKAQRFFYRGKGKLRGREVAAVEDTTKNDVFFLTLGARIDDFELVSFEEGNAVLINLNTEERLTLKRDVD